jgi:hypothetical protein
MSDYLTRLAERVTFSRSRLRPALPSRFEPAKTDLGPGQISWEPVESAAAIDEPERETPGLLAPRPARRAPSIADPANSQRENEGAGHTLIQATRRFEDTKGLRLVSEQAIDPDQTLKAPGRINRSVAVSNILGAPAVISRQSSSPMTGEPRTELREGGVNPRSAGPVPPIEKGEVNFEELFRRGMRAENQLFHPVPALGRETIPQPSLETAESGALAVARRLRHALQSEGESATSRQPPIAPAANGELLPSKGKLSYPTKMLQEKRANDLQLLQPAEIRVTIGKIEVHAIAPPSTSNRTSVPSISKVSLDDYLRSRDGAST